MTSTDRPSGIDFPPVPRAPRGPRVRPVCHTERKLATVLFVDLRESTSLCNTIELEEWWDVISVLYSLLCEGIYRFGGWIGSFTGDGIQAVFETPEHPWESHEHAVRACDAAVWLRDAIPHLHPSHELAARIGLHTGEVLTGTIGDERSRWYTASGYPVALAKRMESIAEPGTIYLSHDTGTLVAARFRLREVGRFVVKGARVPIYAYELQGRRGR